MASNHSDPQCYAKVLTHTFHFHSLLYILLPRKQTFVFLLLLFWTYKSFKYKNWLNLTKSHFRIVSFAIFFCKQSVTVTHNFFPFVSSICNKMPKMTQFDRHKIIFVYQQGDSQTFKSQKLTMSIGPRRFFYGIVWTWVQFPSVAALTCQHNFEGCVQISGWSSPTPFDLPLPSAVKSFKRSQMHRIFQYSFRDVEVGSDA